MAIELNVNYLSKFINNNEYESIRSQVDTAHELLHNKIGLGNKFIGWLDLPENYDKEEFIRIKKAAEKIRNDTDILIVIGIGGSYLGARAVIEYLKSPNYNLNNEYKPKIFFAGNNISSSYISELLNICKDKNVSLNVISKSGTTTEPAIAFRVFREFLENKYGKQKARERIYCTTDKNKGTLKQLADNEGYETFVIPDDVGGRYSVLTAVGLLPIAVSGADIDELMAGANAAHHDFTEKDLNKNICYKYAAIRNILYRKGKLCETIVGYEPRMAMILEWWKQLYGESEGKDGKGLFPTSAMFSTDLHSLGQFIQDGSRIMFETVLSIDNMDNDIIIKEEKDNLDGLNFLSGKTVSEVNKKALEGTVLAHTDGDVPNIIIKIPNTSEYELGYLIYFFEKACAISGYLLGVNPFDQPGVEEYKKNMFALLGKPGYEEKKKDLESRIL